MKTRIDIINDYLGEKLQGYNNYPKLKRKAILRFRTMDEISFIEMVKQSIGLNLEQVRHNKYFVSC